MEPTRCHWPIRDPLMIEYHDREWGEPVHDDRALFEHLVLDGAQAGLSWRTILHKREGYRRAFDNFDMETVARYDDAKIETLLGDPGIVRNRKKIDPGGVRQPRRLLLELCGRQAHRQRLEGERVDPRDLPRVRHP